MRHRQNRQISAVHLPSPVRTRPYTRGSYFASISRSCFSSRSFLRSSRSSSRSSVESPSALFPSSRSACFNQFRIVVSVGSNSSASSDGVRPFRASSTIPSLNLCGYGGRESKEGRAWPPFRLPYSQGRLPHPSSRTAHTVFHSTSALHRTLFGTCSVRFGDHRT